MIPKGRLGLPEVFWRTRRLQKGGSFGLVEPEVPPEAD
jgi:hypothetical protein